MKEGSQEKITEFVPELLIEAARQLRQDQTPAEDVLWECLRDKKLSGLKFRRQHPIKGTAYIADFYCNAVELIVELDGVVHLEPTQQAADRVRQTSLESMGYRVIRFTNDQVFQDLRGVLEAIYQAGVASDSSLPQGEGS